MESKLFIDGMEMELHNDGQIEAWFLFVIFLWS